MSAPKTIQEFIKAREKLVLYVYDDANGNRWEPGDTISGHLTTGYGHVCSKKEAVEFYRGIPIHVAEDLFRGDYKEAQLIVDKYKFPFPKDQPWKREAIISLVFNCGEAPLRKSVGAYLKKGDWVNAGNALSWYNKDKRKQTLDGLVWRRTHELIFFMTGKFPERWDP